MALPIEVKLLKIHPSIGIARQSPNPDWYVTNICIMFTAVEAYQRGYKVTVPPDCVAGLDPSDHALGLRQITDVLKISQE